MKGTLKELQLRQVVGPCMIQITEDVNVYSLCMVRTWDSKEYERIGLYRVTTLDGTDIYVIAEDCNGALSQASCDKTLNLNGAITVRLPFMVRGWGGTVFLGVNEERTIDNGSSQATNAQ